MFNKFIINRNNLINNIKQVINKNPNSKICAMVKANAYGVGVENVVHIIDNYVDFYGVACFFEAENIKKLTNKKILIVGALEKNNINTAFSYTCSSIDDINYLISLNISINIHIKINTGMNRFGISSVKEFSQMLKKIQSSKLNLEGVFTHFATDDDFVLKQMEVFKKYINKLKELKLKPIIHADNSAVNLKFNHHLDMVRIGFNLYNLNKKGFRQVVSIKSKIVQINNIKKGDYVGYNKKFIANKNMKIGIVPIGYADGFDMHNIGLNLYIKGKKCRVLNICMDCFMLDITNTKLKKGTEVSILNKINSLSNYAKHLNTSEYEVMCKFSYIRANRIIC